MGIRGVILRLIVIEWVIIIGANRLSDGLPLLIIIIRLPILHLGLLLNPIGMLVLNGTLAVSVALAVFAVLFPVAVLKQRGVIAFLNVSLSLTVWPAAACLSSRGVRLLIGKLLPEADIGLGIASVASVVPAAATVLHAWPRVAGLRGRPSAASREPLALVVVCRAVLQLVHRLLLRFIVCMLIKIARRAGVVVATVHAERTATIPPHQLFIAPVAGCGPHLLEAIASEVLDGAAFASPALLERNLGTRS